VSVYDKLNSAIKVRHYSPKTLQAYRSWIRSFQAFTLSKSPELVNMDDVKAFLTSLAVEKKVEGEFRGQFTYLSGEFRGQFTYLSDDSPIPLFNM